MAMSSSSPSPADPPPPPSSSSAARLFTAPPLQSRPPNPPLPQPIFPHTHTHSPYLAYQSLPPHQQQHQQQQRQSLVSTTLPVRNLTPRAPTNPIHPRLPSKPTATDPSQGILYPVASSGRGFFPKAIRPQFADQGVTVANPGGFQPRGYPQQVRPFGFPRSDAQVQPLHLMRPTHLQHSLVGSPGGVVTTMVQGVPVSVNPKVAPASPSVPDCNGNKDIKDRSRDDNCVTVRHRKVRISDGSSLYALCRSWLRNSNYEESQPRYMDDVKTLPRPLPIPVADAHSPVKKGGDGEEEQKEEESVEELSAPELLQRHVKRAKKVRARLREERLQRIARYKTRLALLLPPIVEQQFRNDSTTGNLQMPL